MQLSILLPTHRSSLLACSRIAQVCSLASPDVEVIVRDNSGDPKKRELLSYFRCDYCNIILAEPCDLYTNYSETLQQARGEFVFVLADDDYCFDHAIPALTSAINSHGGDASVVGITGAYIAESSRGSAIVSYEKVDAGDPVTRVKAYLAHRGTNVLYYSSIRREVVQRIFAFMNAMPDFFSFHDQTICMLYLLNGRFISLNRLLYLYDVGEWDTAESAEKRDVTFYTRAGLDPAINVLHWFLCGLEGAILVRNTDLFPDCRPADRQLIADLWFSVMFNRFQTQVRQTYGSSFAGAAEKIRGKLLQTAGRVLFDEQLAEITGFMSLFAPDWAGRYQRFWAGVLSGRKPEPVAASPAQPAPQAERKTG
jgi:hypothetical protein